ncbi:MAG: 23S rRNA (guanosine(2251)-2'-O)-methyltransferase RlmB [Oceanococcus sp.]
MSDSWIGGFHAVESRLKSAAVERIELDRARRDRRARQLQQLAERYDVPVVRVGPTVLDARHGELKHQGVSALLSAQAEVEIRTWQDCIEGVEKPLILVLDEVEDPRNMGACLRVADGAGAHCVVIPKRRAAGLNDVARKTAAGAAESVPLIVVGNLARTLKEMAKAGLYIVGLADADDHSLYAENLDQALVMVVGNEGRGLRQLSQEHCDALASLPMAGSVSSLNVSVACGVALYEAVRQRSNLP